MHSLKFIKFTVHLDNGYGKPVCSCSAKGKLVKMGDGAYNCRECSTKYNAAKEKQDQIDELNRLEHDIRKQLYVNNDNHAPRIHSSEKEYELNKQLTLIQRKRKAVISTVNTIESEIMTNLAASRLYSQRAGATA